MKRPAVKRVAGGLTAFLTGSALVLASATPALAAPNDPVSFPDQNFKNCLADTLGVPRTSTITEGQLASIQYATCTGTPFDDENNISDLTGAEYLTGAESISLQENSISDLTPLAGLTQLENLNLGINYIEDVSPLAGLTGLKRLTLWGNEIRDISPLAGLNLEGDATALSLGGQGINLDNVPINTPIEIGLKDINGNRITPTVLNNDGTYDPATDTVTFTDTYANLEWSVPTTIGGVSDDFEGTFFVTVVDDTVYPPSRTDAFSNAPGEVDFGWQAAFEGDDYEVASYEVRYRPVGTTSWTTVNVAKPTNADSVVNHVFTGLTGDTVYEFQVATVADNGQKSAYTESVEIEVTGLPQPVTGITYDGFVEDDGTGTMDIDWDNVDTNGNGWVEDYIVTYAPAGSTEAPQQVTTYNPWVTLTGLDPTRAYIVTVSYVTDTGLSPQTATSQTVFFPGVAPAPTGVTVSDITSTSAVISWDEVTETNNNGTVEEYQVAVTTPGGQSGEVIPVPADSTSVRINLAPNTEYEVYVAYTTSTGVASVYAPVTVQTPAMNPSPTIQNLTATSGSNAGEVTLIWDALNSTQWGTGGNGEVTAYTVYYREAGGEWVEIGTETGDGNANTSVITGLPAGEYEFAVTYSTDTITSEFSNIASLEVTNGVSNGDTPPATGGGNNNDGGSEIVVTGEGEEKAAGYENCAAAGEAGIKLPIQEGQEGYSKVLDRDGDGIACEDGEGSSDVDNTGVDTNLVAIAGGSLIGLALLLLGGAAIRKRITARN